MADSPELNSDGVLSIALFSDGTAIDPTIEVVSIVVRRSAGTIPSATIVISDGNMADGGWPVANKTIFAPGATIGINAGYGNINELVFEGIVTKMEVRISSDNFSRLHIHCHDKAIKMTVGRHSVNYIDKKDSDIILSLLSKHNVSDTVDSTNVTFREIVQYYCSDWDFLMARAEVNGLLVIAENGQVSVIAPGTSAEADLTVTYGLDLIDFSAEIDARRQYSNVTAVAWDPKNQSVVEASAKPAAFNKQGNLDSITLADVLDAGDFTLQSAASLNSEALTAWAKGQQQKAGLSRIRGSMRFQGSAKAKVGGTIELAGVGERYNGTVFVGGLTHTMADGNWVTTVDFGLPDDWFAERTDIVAPPAAGWMPGAAGLQIGIVSKLDNDPAGENRIGINVPVLKAETPMIWARLMQFYASSGFGAFYLPEIGDEVVLGYFNDDPSSPVILGSLYSSNRKPAYPFEAKNNIKSLTTRSKSEIKINDDTKTITILTPAGNKIIIDDAKKSIVLLDQHTNNIEMNAEGISLTSSKDIKLSAKGNISADAKIEMNLTAGTNLEAKALGVTIEAKTAFTAKGTASAELSASGPTTVRGAMVMIN
jgi:Rhs element Vgr protein